MKYILFVGAMVASLCQAIAQPTFPVNGTLDKGSTVYILENATLHTDAVSELVGDIAVSQGTIVAVGKLGDAYNAAVRIDATGMHIYPSFIDLWSDAGMPEERRAERKRGPQDESSKKGAFGWNEAIRPEIRAAELYTSGNKSDRHEALRKAGFGAVLTHQHDGILRGTASLVVLDDNDHKAVVMPDAAAVASLRKGSSQQDYPSALMGSIALLRQTFYDADWYAISGKWQETNLSLEALNRTRNLPWFFQCNDVLDILRADKIGKEFNIPFVFKENGDSYQRLDAVAKTGGTLILSLDYPEAMDVSDPYLARLVSLAELKHWELAPSNAARVHKAGIPFTFTAYDLKEPGAALDRIRTAIAHGLPKDAALRALTETPAKLIGADNRLGRLQKGFIANFIVADGDLFEPGANIVEHWVNGVPNTYSDRFALNLAGDYELKANGKTLSLKLTGSAGKPEGRLTAINGTDTLSVDVKVTQEDALVSMRFPALENHFNGVTLLSGGFFEDEDGWLRGQGQLADGSWFDWSARRTSPSIPEKKKKDAPQVDEGGAILYPFTAYGRTQMPEQETLLITNATVWTCEEEGVIENGQVLIHKGKIIAVGQNLKATALVGKGTQIAQLDAKGKHDTPGIIDEHSHIAVSGGVNEGTQASSAEVSIATVVNSEDINIYRQLSGGVTAAQLLHGSSNPIGGQSAVVKLRWGATPDEMHIDGAAPFIKFALGENVKQSNWGDYYTSRFPQTRMGVEQVYYDHFIRAREYGEEWAAYKQALLKKRKGDVPVAPRRDLEMETILQILNKERFISCHSYRQDEINMLMHVGDSLGFTVNTFTHILEGYKVADKMAQHGAGGSSFSDWWAYKYEVKDAIPYNGAVLWSQGVTTAFNSDDAEMARRLNQEAAKAVKYGNVPEAEALKFVTLNPAKLLHLDDRTGSLKVGKDADLVIWSDHPLSIYAKAEATFVDGRRLFDAQEDQRLRQFIVEERARLIQKMLDAGGGKGKKPTERMPRHYHCDTLTEENR